MSNHVCMLRCVWLLAVPWTVANQAPLSKAFFRQEYWSRSPFPSPGVLPGPRIKPLSLVSPVSPTLADRFFTSRATNGSLKIGQQYLWAFLVAQWASLMAQSVRNLPAMQETQVQSWDWEDPLEKEMVTCSSIPAHRIPWREEFGGLQFMGLQRVRLKWLSMYAWRFLLLIWKLTQRHPLKRKFFYHMIQQAHSWSNIQKR